MLAKSVNFLTPHSHTPPQTHGNPCTERHIGTDAEASYTIHTLASSLSLH